MDNAVDVAVGLTSGHAKAATTRAASAAAIARSAFHTFNADLDPLEPGRDTAGGETTFLALLH